MQNSKKLRKKQEEELLALRQHAAVQSPAKENNYSERRSIRPSEKKKAVCDQKKEIWSTERSDQKRSPSLETAETEVILSKNTETGDEAIQSGELANSSELDISLPLSPATMSIINTSLSNNSAFAAFVEDDHSDECVTAISTVLTDQNECTRPESTLCDSEGKSDITIQSNEPINAIKVGDLEPPATVALSNELPLPYPSTIICQTRPQIPIQSPTSCDITSQLPEPTNTITVGDSGPPATVALSDDVPLGDPSTTMYQARVPVQSYHSDNIPTLPSAGLFEIGSTSAAKKEKAKNGLADKSKWQKVQRKQQRMSGEAYCSSLTDANGTHIMQKPRVIGERCTSKRCSKSRHCNDFSEEDRQRIFSNFWKDMDWGQRKVHVANLAEAHDVKRRTAEDTRRQCSITYYLRKDRERLQVCREMFLSTLCLGEWSVRNWVTNNIDGIQTTNKDRHILTTSRQSEALEMRESVRKFLSNLPKLPSHYCRASTSKEYLEPQFQSVAEVYRAFEKQQAGRSPSRQVFTEEFHKMNLGLYMPKKDQCDKCSAYAVGNLPQEDYNEHIMRKEEARTSKTQDKERAKEGNCHVFTMDVQAVQLIPYLQASALYFKQKLAVHNFTLYNLANDDVVCYVWHEGEGELNANIFASFVTSYLENETECDKEVIIYSDGCGNQNRNATLSNALSALARKKGISIIQKYLEKGHTQMECDSVHSVIERRKKHRDLHCPAQYVQLIKEARLKTPYKVHYVQHDFFKDYSSLRMYSSIRPGRKVGDPTVTDLRCIKYLPSGEIQWKLRHTDDWKLLLQPRRGAIHGCDDANIKPLYSSSIPIKFDKYKDLQSLKSVILPDFHSFYDTLRHQ